MKIIIIKQRGGSTWIKPLDKITGITSIRPHWTPNIKREVQILVKTVDEEVILKFESEEERGRVLDAIVDFYESPNPLDKVLRIDIGSN